MGLFSSDLEFDAQYIGLESYKGTLVFSPDEIAFYPTFTGHADIHLPADSITNFALSTSDTRTAEVTLLRLLFLKWLAFAFPKRSGNVSTTVTVRTSDRQISFRIDDEEIDEIQPQIIPYLDSWGIMLN